jgi:hypothetical protein
MAQKTLTVQRCLARADRLRTLADGAADYRDLLHYEGLATEWLVLAGRLAAVERDAELAPRPPASRLQILRVWFRILAGFDQTRRLE